MKSRLYRCSLFVLLSLVARTTFAVRTRVTWVNGIGYSEEDMEKECDKLSKLFGADVSYCHNPSAMVNENDMVGYLNDLTQAGTQKLGRVTMEVNALVKHLKSAVAAVGMKGRVIHIAHSQGALVTHLASKQLSLLEMNCIDVIAFGGAAALRRTPRTPFHRCINYYSVNDPLLWVVPSAEQALRSGFVIDEEFCFLAPKIGDPIQDHYLLNPTYAQALSWEGRRYQREYHGLASRGIRSFSVFVWAILDMIITAMATFVDILSRRLQTFTSPVFCQVREILLFISRYIVAGLLLLRQCLAQRRDRSYPLAVG